MSDPKRALTTPGWRFEPLPSETGWYPTLVCWDAHEGEFPGAHYWNGASWDAQPGDPGERRFWPQRCGSQAEATEVAYEHDPDA